MKEFLQRRAVKVFERRNALYMRISFTVLQRSLDLLVVTVLLIVTVTFIYRPARLFPVHRNVRYLRREQLNQQLTFPSVLPDDGFHFGENRLDEKFLSYEPPIGSWSKQLLAFQNAVIIAALLNRTLIAQPLISEVEGKRLRTVVRKQLQSDSEAYRLIDLRYMVPISAVINLKLLRQLLRVKAIHSTYSGFLEQYQNLTWHNVCHKDTVGFWVDFIPSPTNEFAWRILEAQEFVPLKSYFHGVEPVCEHEMEMIGHLRSPQTPVLRGILSELAGVQKEIIYFRGGSLAARELRFLSKQRTKQVQNWITKYIQFSSYVQNRIHSILRNMKRPYNAVKINKNSNLEIMNNTIRFRLREMEKKRFRSVTNRLYVINEFQETYGLRILEDSGFQLYSTTDLIPRNISEYIKQDVQKLLGEVLCKYARYYEGPLDSYVIQRARLHEARSKDGILTDLITVQWAFHTVSRNHRIALARETRMPRNMAYHPLIPIWCKLCRTIKKSIKVKLCRPITNECVRQKL